jgi:hypothetical protein
LVAVTAGLAGGLLHPLGGLLLVAALAAHTAFVTSVGVWLSAACRTTTRARVLMAVLLLALIGGGIWQAAGQADPYGREPFRMRASAATVAANPIGTWTCLTFSWYDLDSRPVEERPLLYSRLRLVACGIAAYGLVAGGLFLDARRRFLREPMN